MNNTQKCIAIFTIHFFTFDSYFVVLYQAYSIKQEIKTAQKPTVSMEITYFQNLLQLFH